MRWGSRQIAQPDEPRKIRNRCGAFYDDVIATREDYEIIPVVIFRTISICLESVT